MAYDVHPFYWVTLLGDFTTAARWAFGLLCQFVYGALYGCIKAPCCDVETEMLEEYQDNFHQPMDRLSFF